MYGFLRWCVTLILLFALATPAWGRDRPVNLGPVGTVKSLLQTRVGQSVELVLTSGPRLAGKVVSVAEHLVHLGQLRKMEFFDAVVRLEQIEAVILRVRGG